MKIAHLPHLLVAALLFSANAQANPITDNDYDDFDPIIKGDLIVWQAYVPDDAVIQVDPPVDPDIEIMARYKGDTRRVTDNDGDDINPKISGNQIVWQSWDGNDWEIWTYNAETDTSRQLTDNDGDDINPCIDGDNVVWQCMEDGDADYEICATSIRLVAPIDATLRITPRVLNLRSRGRWVSASLSIPSGTNAGAIDPSTILLEGSIPAENVTGRGTTLRMKFDRQALQALLTGPGSEDVTVTAETANGAEIIATDTLRVIP